MNKDNQLIYEAYLDSDYDESSQEPEMEVDDEGNKSWRLEGEYHRTDGPAVINADGYKSWWLYGRRHRMDGPAIINADGDLFWFIHGNNYGTATNWARSVLMRRNQPHDPDSVANFLRPILAKSTKDLI